MSNGSTTRLQPEQDSLEDGIFLRDPAGKLSKGLKDSGEAE